MSLEKEIKTPHLTYTQPLGLYINGEWTTGKEGATFETINPATEKPIVAVHEAKEADVDIAVAAARKAFDGVWKQTSPLDRGKYLSKLADLFEKEIETLAAIESLDNGKSINMAKADVGLAAGCLRYYGGWSDKVCAS